MRPTRKPFDSRLQDLQDFLTREGRCPSEKGPADEAQLTRWFQSNRYKHVHGALAPERAHAFAEVTEQYFAQPRRNRPVGNEDRLDQLQRWCQAHGRMPRALSGNREPATAAEREEQILGRWAARHYSARPQAEPGLSLRAAVCELRVQYLSAGTALKRVIADEKLEQATTEILAFLAANGRRPHPGGGAAEANLLYRYRRWVNAERSGLLPDHQAAAVRDLHSTYCSGAYGLSLSAQGLTPAEQLREFHALNGRLPHHELEPSRYTRLRMLRHKAGNGEIRDSELEILKAIPGVLKRVRLDPLPRLEALTQWCEANGCIPRHTIRLHHRALTPEEETEQSLGQWMYRHVVRRHKDAKETSETRFVRYSILALKAKYPKHSYTSRQRAAPATGVAA